MTGAVYGVSHIHIPVRELPRAVLFYGSVLGFAPKESGEGWTDLDAGSTLIRLMESEEQSRSASLRVQVGSVAEVHRAAVAAGCTSAYAPARSSAHEESATVRDQDGNVVVLWRPLSEDEYGYLPELPIRTEWSDEAQALLKALLLAVPSLFRGLARRRVVRVAEEMFPKTRISPRDVVRAYILASARVTRYRLVEPIRKQGFDPAEFEQDFSAD